MSVMSVIPFLKRHWALVLAGLLVVFVAGGASVARFTRDLASAPPAVSSPPR
jgi:hypothetical protein